jgi:DNA-binding NarL/FixJ family response regulator
LRRIRILVADDHAVLRAGLRMLVSAQPDMRVAGEAASGTEAVKALQETRPDVVLLDLSMPGGGAECIERIVRERPSARVLVLTMHDDPAYARRAVEAGAAGYIVKKAADTELLSAIRSVHGGGTFVNVSVRAPTRKEAPLSDPSWGLAEGGRGRSGISRREQEVLVLLAHGYTNREIAERIRIGIKTVETYRSRLAHKLGLNTRAECVQYALVTGLLAVPRRTRGEA